jgi:hypothetical protein
MSESLDDELPSDIDELDELSVNIRGVHPTLVSWQT